MEESEKLWIASKAKGKEYTYDQVRWSDDLYGKSEFVEDVLAYMKEYDEIGSKAFYDKYKDYKLY